MMPSEFKCQSQDCFIGPAKSQAEFIGKMVKLAKSCNSAAIKLLILGPSGAGKSQLSDHFCRVVGSSKWATHRFNGTAFRIDDVEDLARTMHLKNPYGDYRVVQLEEVDRCNPVVQVRILTLLDDMPNGNAIICTSNCALKDLEPRFQSRFQVIQLQPPSAEQIAEMLCARWAVSASIARQISTLAMGNVRQALLDCQSYLCS